MKNVIKSIDRGMFISFIIFMTFTIFIDNLIVIDWGQGSYTANIILWMSIITFLLLLGISMFMFVMNIKTFVRNYRWIRNQ